MTKIKVDLIKDPFGWYVIDAFGKSWRLPEVIDMNSNHQPNDIRDVIDSSISNPFLYTNPALWDEMEDQDNPPLKPGIANDTNLIIAHWGVESPTIPDDFAEWVLHEYENGKAYFFGTYADFPLFFELVEEYTDPDINKPQSTPPVILTLSGDINVHVFIQGQGYNPEED